MVFPCYNDRDAIGPLIRETRKILQSCCREYEIIVVDDGSTDGSPETLEKLGREIGELRLLFHEKNRGYGSTIRSGFDLVRFPYVFYTDGDGQYGPADMPLLIHRMREDVQIVTGYRGNRQDPWMRILGSRLFYGFVKTFAGISFRDISCDYRLMRKEVLDSLELEAEGGELGLEILLKSHFLGYRVVEWPVAHYPRQHGSSAYFRPRVLAQTVKGVSGVFRWKKERNL